MKLARIGEFRSEKPCVLTDKGERLDLFAYFSDWDAAFLSGGGLAQFRAILESQQSFLPRFP